MVLPLVLGLLGSGLGSAGMLGGLGALGAGAIGSGLGSYLETGDLEKGILTGLGSFAGGTLAGKLMGGAAAAGTGAGAGSGISQATKDAITGSVASAAGPQGGVGAMLGKGAFGDVARGGMAFAGTPTGIGAGIGGALGGAMSGMMGGKGKGEGGGSSDVDSSESFPLPRNYIAPPAGYRPGYDPEWNYGLSTPQSATDIRNYSRQRQFYGGGVVKALGPIKLAEGGIASLAGADGEEYNADAGVDAPAGGNEKDVVVEAIRAIKGQVDDPRIPLGKFLAMYGEDALRDLVEKVQSGKAEGEASKDGGRVQGPGDGMDDRVPAKIKETGEDVLLADSEYVVPADVVSHLGNGSSDAGAKVLDDMLTRVRESRTGKKDQAPAINPKEVIPA